MSEEITPETEPAGPGNDDVQAHLAAGQDSVLGLQRLDPEKEAARGVVPVADSGGSCHNISCF